MFGEAEADPVTATRQNIFVDPERLFFLRPDFQRGDEKVNATVGIEILRDDVSAIFFKGYAKQVGCFQKRLAAQVQVKAIFFVTPIGILTAPSTSKFSFEVKSGGGVICFVRDVLVMEPIFGFVIAHGLVAFQAIGDVNVGKSVVVEISRAAPP